LLACRGRELKDVLLLLEGDSMGYVFSTDVELRIIAFGEELSELCGRKTAEVQGKKYYEILPRILSDDSDALSLAIDKNKTLKLRNYKFHCLLNHTSADIRISPVRSAKRVKGVTVTFSELSPCPVAMSLENSQRFIDIGKTASTFAHGIRNPLNAIKGAVVYLKGKYSNEPSLIEFANIMEEEIARLDNLISKYLGAAISDTSFTLTDMNSILSKMEALTSFQMRARNIESVYELGDIPRIMVNTFQIEPAILNVLNNSIDAMKSGGRLLVRTRTETISDKCFVMIEVSDTGGGMSGNGTDVPTIPTKGKGRGYGLVIVREVLQCHEGHLTIRSKKGKGTSVLMYLPVKK
jgi:two-component system nitrogen regulation sensor histidine kinase GlnL